MPVKTIVFKINERNLKGGGIRPGYEYQGVDVKTIRTDNPANLLEDLLEISSGDLGKIAEFTAAGFNEVKAKESNPMADDVVKAVLAAMKATGKKVDIAKAQKIAAEMKAKVESNGGSE